MEELDFEDLDRYLLKQNGKIIHQIWFGTIPNKKEASKAFEGMRKYRDSWLLKNPSWTYISWNIDRCLELVKHHYAQHREMYDNYPYPIQKCDTIRYFILHRYGGLYADMDYYCNRPWDEVLQNYKNDIYLVETPNKLGNEKTIHISNSLMYSRPRHVFWSKLFIELEQNQTLPRYYGRHITIMFSTGPGILNRVYNMYRTRYRLNYYPYKLFHPFGLSSNIMTLQNKDKVYAYHLGKGSWENSDSKILIFIYQEYGILLFIFLTLILPSLAYYAWKRSVIAV
jgi:mannosyltransferase OCH1-like enzyme